jgi:hypothetical protein
VITLAGWCRVICAVLNVNGRPARRRAGNRCSNDVLAGTPDTREGLEGRQVAGVRLDAGDLASRHVPRERSGRSSHHERRTA